MSKSGLTYLVKDERSKRQSFARGVLTWFELVVELEAFSIPGPEAPEALTAADASAEAAGDSP